MRQKDIDQITAIAEKEIDFASPDELEGMQMLLGAIQRTVAYGNGDLDFTGMEEQIERCKPKPPPTHVVIVDPAYGGSGRDGDPWVLLSYDTRRCTCDRPWAHAHGIVG